MRFLLYNIRYGTGIGRQFHLPLPFMGLFKRTDRNLSKIIDFIESLSPDIVGLVEVDIGSFRTSRENQARALAERIAHSPVFQSKYGSGSVADALPILSKQGNALLTNQAIQSRQFHYLNMGLNAWLSRSNWTRSTSSWSICRCVTGSGRINSTIYMA